MVVYQNVFTYRSDKSECINIIKKASVKGYPHQCGGISQKLTHADGEEVRSQCGRPQNVIFELKLNILNLNCLTQFKTLYARCLCLRALDDSAYCIQLKTI